jgi:hypothetical protein
VNYIHYDKINNKINILREHAWLLIKFMFLTDFYNGNGDVTNNGIV